MAYKVHMTDGSVITVATATRAHRDGSGTYLFDAGDNQVASFSDGQVKFAIPAESEVETPAE